MDSKKTLIKPEWNGKRFSYPGENLLATPMDVLRWVITRKATKWPAMLENPPADPIIERVSGTDLRITFINHATVLIQSGGLNLITDPVFSKRVSPVSFAGPKRHRKPGLSLDEIPPIDVVLLSHTHYDHMDARSLKWLQTRDAPVMLAPENTAPLLKQICGCDAKTLSWWDEHILGGDTKATLVPARHWTSRSLGDQNKALWGGYVITLPGGSVYFAGDTGYGGGDHFVQIQQELGPFRCALLPIGAYEPRWFMKPQHMNPEEAVKSFIDLQADYAVGIHHGTFQLTDEAHDAPVAALNAALNAQGVPAERFRALANGQTWDIPLSDIKPQLA